jgi:hypothetical protein
MPMGQFNKTVDEYRQLAQKFREIARMTLLEDERTRLLEVAQTWDLIAERVGRASSQQKAGEPNPKEIIVPRQLIEPHKGDKRYVRRGKKGEFTSRQPDVGRSLSADRRSKAKTIVKKGEGDRGDRRSD